MFASVVSERLCKLVIVRVRCRLQTMEMMDHGPDEDVDWPAMPAAAVLMLAGLLLNQ